MLPNAKIPPSIHDAKTAAIKLFYSLLWQIQLLLPLVMHTVE